MLHYLEWKTLVQWDQTNFQKVYFYLIKILVKPYKYEASVKEPVPKKDEKPIHGLKSNKNFIVANAVENILSAPK